MLFNNEDLINLRNDAKEKYGECILTLSIYEDNFLAKIQVMNPNQTIELEPNTLELI